MLLFFDLVSDVIFGAPLLILYYQAPLPFPPRRPYA